ncbi:hypothetical protein ACFLU6_08895 [Acidobacteriota bacterium]
MKQGGKIFATLLVLTLCIGVNLYAENRSRSIGSNDNGDLNLNILAGVQKPLEIKGNSGSLTVNGSAVTRTGRWTAVTDDGTPIRLEHLGEKTRIHVGDQSVVIYANGSVPIQETETYLPFGFKTLTFEDPVTGMPINVTGTVRLRDFTVDPQNPIETELQRDEYDVRLENYQTALKALEDSGLPKSTVEIGGVSFDIFANGDVFFDPTLPEKFMLMDSKAIEALDGARIPATIPQFTLDNGRLLFPSGGIRKAFE